MPDTPNPVPIVRYALELVAQGFHVFPVHGVTRDLKCTCGSPCGRIGKHPRTKHGLKDASVDEAKVIAWFSAMPDSNIAIATGQSKLIVIDVDPRNNGDEALIELLKIHGELPRTRMCLTGGGGQHYYFNAPPGLEGVRSHVPVQGVEIKANGAYIIAPPSKHLLGTYVWDSGQGDEIAPAPFWLIDMPKKAGGMGGPPVDGLMGRAFVAAGMGGPSVGPTKMAVRCPWANEHTQGSDFDSSTVVFGPSGGGTLGAFHCSHSHCQARLREAGGWKAFQKVVLDSLNPEAVTEAKRVVKGGAEAARALEPRAVWEASIKYTRHGDPAAEAGNLQVMLENLPEWKACVVYDEAHDRITWARTPPEIHGMRTPLEGEELDDAAWIYAAHWFSIRRNVTFRKETMQDVLVAAAKARPINTLVRHLEALMWDGTPRIEHWLSAYCGAVNTPYTRFVGKAWLISSIARAMQPGCQCDHMLVLEGKQGQGKTTVFRIFGGEWYSSFSVARIDDKDAKMHLHGSWIVEVAELAALQYGDMVKAKAFLTECVDRYRPPYARTFIESPRHCVFGGSTNEGDYVRDQSGGRRFWPVICNTIALEALAADRDQLLAEAVHEFRRGTPWWPDRRAAELLGMLEEQQEMRLAVEPWEQILRDKVLPLGPSAQILPAELLRWVQVDIARQTRQDTNRVSGIMRKLGYDRERRSMGESGIMQWVWVKVL